MRVRLGNHLSIIDHDEGNASMTADNLGRVRHADDSFVKISRTHRAIFPIISGPLEINHD